MAGFKSEQPRNPAGAWHVPQPPTLHDIAREGVTRHVETVPPSAVTDSDKPSAPLGRE